MTQDDRMETIAAETDNPTVCITHGRFIPCRNEDWHHFTDNPYWVKSVRDFQGSDDPNLTWEPATLTITDPAEIRACDEPDERGDFPCCTTPAPVSGAGLDLDAVPRLARLVLVDALDRAEAAEAEVRRLTEENASYADELLTCDREEWRVRAEAAEADVQRLASDAVGWKRLYDAATTVTVDNMLAVTRAEAAEAEVVTLRARLAEAEALHWKVGGACSHCSQRSDYAVAWPCETAVALAGTTGEGQ